MKPLLHVEIQVIKKIKIYYYKKIKSGFFLGLSTYWFLLDVTGFSWKKNQSVLIFLILASHRTFSAS
jgi:hypothetical protein